MLLRGVLLSGLTLGSCAILHNNFLQNPLATVEAEKVPGENNATYCTVPQSEQLFQIEYWNIAPHPVSVDEIFFTLLRGWISNDVVGLEYARLYVTGSSTLRSGKKIGPITWSRPLESFAADDLAHFTIRYRGGKFGGPLMPGTMEIITDFWFPGDYIEAGQWTFKIEGILRAADDQADRYLFAFQTSQWLEGRSPERR